MLSISLGVIYDIYAHMYKIKLAKKILLCIEVQYDLIVFLFKTKLSKRFGLTVFEESSIMTSNRIKTYFLSSPCSLWQNDRFWPSQPYSTEFNHKSDVFCTGLYQRVVHKYTDSDENLNEKWFHQSGTEMFLVQSEIHREWWYRIYCHGDFTEGLYVCTGKADAITSQ